MTNHGPFSRRPVPAETKSKNWALRRDPRVPRVARSAEVDMERVRADIEHRAVAVPADQLAPPATLKSVRSSSAVAPAKASWHQNRHQPGQPSRLLRRLGRQCDLNLLEATPGIEPGIAVLQFGHVCSSASVDVHLEVRSEELEPLWAADVRHSSPALPSGMPSDLGHQRAPGRPWRPRWPPATGASGHSRCRKHRLSRYDYEAAFMIGARGDRLAGDVRSPSGDCGR